MSRLTVDLARCMAGETIPQGLTPEMMDGLRPRLDAALAAVHAAAGKGWLEWTESPFQDPEGLLRYAAANHGKYDALVVVGIGGSARGTIALATMVVNLRHVFYGLSLLKQLPNGKLLRWYLAFGLTDETYSVLTTMPVSTSHRQMALVALLNQVWWVLGTTAGVLIGARAQVSLAGLDFVLAALFAVLAVEQWRTKHSAAPVWVALIAYAVAYLLAAKHALVISISLSIVAGFVLQSRSKSSTPSRQASHD